MSDKDKYISFDFDDGNGFTVIDLSEVRCYTRKGSKVDLHWKASATVNSYEFGSVEIAKEVEAVMYRYWDLKQP